MPTVFRSPIPTISRPSSRLISRPSSPGRCSQPISRAFRARRRARSISWSISTRKLQKTDPLHHPHGAGHPDAGGDAGLRRRLVPRLRVAVDPDPAASRARRALRLRLSHSAASRHRSGRGTARGRERFHRSARLGRGLSSRRRLDRLRRHLGHADRRGAYPRRRHAALSLGGADLRRGRLCQCRIRLRDERQAHPRGAAHHKAVLRRILGAARPARRAGRCRSEGAATCA